MNLFFVQYRGPVHSNLGSSVKQPIDSSPSERVKNCAKSIASTALSGISEAVVALKPLELTKNVSHICLEVTSDILKSAGCFVERVGVLGGSVGVFDAYACNMGMVMPWSVYNAYIEPNTILENVAIYLQNGSPRMHAERLWRKSTEPLTFPQDSLKPLEHKITEQVVACICLVVSAGLAGKVCYTAANLVDRVNRLF